MDVKRKLNVRTSNYIFEFRVVTFDICSVDLGSRNGSISVFQSGHSLGEPGKPGKVREFKSGQGKVTEKRKSRGKCVLAYGQLPRVLMIRLARCQHQIQSAVNT